MMPLVDRWAQGAMAAHPGLVVHAEGGGTGVGVEALIEGRADLCAASRTMDADEVRRLLDARGFLGLSILVAKDAVSVYVHRGNEVRNLARAQLGSIYRGEVTNWRELGGKDRAIDRLGRQPNSGTYAFLRDHVLPGADYDDGVLALPTTDAVVREVSRRPWSIGYGGMAFGDDIVRIAVDGVEPTVETVRDGTYPLSRYLYFYAAGELPPPVRDFVEWVLSDEGQRVAEALGFVPLWAVGDREADDD
jgi:phosphate transport system substrate-binding protein